MSTGVVAAFSLILLLALIFSGVHLSTSPDVYQYTQCIPVYRPVLDGYERAEPVGMGAVRQYMFGVIPLFVLMGLLANLSGASQDLYDSASLLLKKVRGRRRYCNGCGKCDFAAITGVTVASAAVFTKIALPQIASEI